MTGTSVPPSPRNVDIHIVRFVRYCSVLKDQARVHRIRAASLLVGP